MAEKITIARISRFKNDKDGNQFVNKQGKPFTKVLIDTTDGRTLSGFASAQNTNWNDGMEVEVDITEREYNGKTYYNFSVPKSSGGGFTDADRQMLRELYEKLVKSDF